MLGFSFLSFVCLMYRNIGFIDLNSHPPMTFAGLTCQMGILSEDDSTRQGTWHWLVACFHSSMKIHLTLRGLVTVVTACSPDCKGGGASVPGSA